MSDLLTNVFFSDMADDIRKWSEDLVESNYCVYKHTSPNGKVYIGVTKNKSEERWRNGLGYRKHPHFFNAICKYGWDNFQHEILAVNLSYDEASKMEVDLIASHDAANREHGYNLRLGGSMCTHGEETRRKLSILKMGNKYCAGRKLSPETKRKISIANTRRKISPETKLKMSISAHARKASPETCEAISKALKAAPMTEARARHLKDIQKMSCRSVEQCDLNGNVIARFNSMNDAANSVNGSRYRVSEVCRKIRKTYKGYKWRYCDESN
jgi:group I intron endonuclease